MALLGCASLALGSCGGDDEQARPAATPTKFRVTVTEGRDGRLLVSAPRSVPAGVVTVELRNNGKRIHESQLVRLDPGHTVAEALPYITGERPTGPIPGWIHTVGGNGNVQPGGSASGTQRLSPGNYFVLDDPLGEEARFGVAPFKVTGEDSGGELPKATGRVEAREYTFAASGLRRGKNPIEFVNTGREIHHVVAVPFEPGATLADVRRSFRRGEAGEDPPLDFDKGRNTALIDGGTRQVADLELRRPGKYALLCFIRDRKGGAAHVAKGMIAEATVR